MSEKKEAPRHARAAQDQDQGQGVTRRAAERGRGCGVGGGRRPLGRALCMAGTWEAGEELFVWCREFGAVSVSERSAKPTRAHKIEVITLIYDSCLL